MDLKKNKYHIFNPENAKKKGYYPSELLQMIEELSNFEKEFNIEVGEIYTVRAFFAISKPINNEVGYQSGFLDVKLIMNESENFIGEVITELPPMFVLKKGSKIKLKKRSNSKLLKNLNIYNSKQPSCRNYSFLGKFIKIYF